MIIINEGYYPRHLGVEWLKGYELIVNDRVDAKSKGNKTKADMLKISVNGAYGLTKSEHSWMFDPRLTLSVCINGELSLLMLIEAIELHTDCVVVYSNTDGLTVRVPIGSKPDFDHICNAWMKYTNFGLEYTKYKRMILKDVNNYIIEYYKEQDDKTFKIALKQKGEFVTGIKLATGYEYPIIPIALEKYFINNIPVEQTIKSHTSIYDFMRAEKSSAKFKMIHQSIEQLGTKDYTKLQKNNRWIVTKNNPLQGKLFKIELNIPDDEEDGSDQLIIAQETLFDVDIDENAIIGRKELEAGFLTTIVNNVDESIDISNYKLNYSYYIDKANDIIRKIEHTHTIKQEKLF